MPRLRPAAFALALPLLGLAAPEAGAQAQIADILCKPTQDMRQMLETRFGITRQGAGMRYPSQMMELWRDEAGEWALVARYATGTSCILAVGEAWHDPAPKG
jgi:hypothetical protein